MKELLPLALGFVVGAGLYAAPLGRAKTILLPLACVLAGGLASWANGELVGGPWLFFVSFDSILVWAGAATAVALGALRARIA